MPLNKIVDSRDVQFVLFEILKIHEAGKKYPVFADHDRDIYEEIIALAERIAVGKIQPSNAPGDKIGCAYNPSTKEVAIPPMYRDGIDAFIEAGFGGLMDPVEKGGMGMPVTVEIACTEFFTGANLSLISYPGLAHGAMNLIEHFGTDEMKKIYCGKMMSGAWGGTMCLTEPDAGSDVGALKTKAFRQDDGTYLIQGQKIFITSAENDYYENIIHPVLARIEGDPSGTKGISIFIVPKFLVNADGSIGQRNDMICSGIEHKMGIKGSATCSLSFGDNGKCAGYLLGEERHGMKIMFHMMNEARLGVGLQGLALASTAYMHAVTYARNRIQGVHITQMMNPAAKSVPIIQHPDIKRMLLWMKSYVEGMRILTYFLGQCIDTASHGSGEEAKEALGLADLLLPICKAGNTDASTLVTSEAVQVYGGYGYCSDYPVEQFMRDSKILSLYEGTNGIQSLDLTMRKIIMNPGQYNYNVFRSRVAGTIAAARGIVDEKYITLVEQGLARLDAAIDYFKSCMVSMKIMNILINATPLQQAMHILALAWCHLWALIQATQKRKELIGNAKGEELNKILAENTEAAYYNGRVLSAQFYIGSEFKKYFGRIDAMMSDESAVIKANEFTFTGAPLE